MPNIDAETVNLINEAEKRGILDDETRLLANELRTRYEVQQQDKDYGMNSFFSGVYDTFAAGEDDLNFTDYLSAGWQNSVLGLAVRGEQPDKSITAETPIGGAVVSGIMQEAGDLPATIAGFLGGGAAGGAAGGAVGSAVPVVGTAVGAGVGTTVGGFGGAVALPQAMRAGLMEYYDEDGNGSWQEFWEVMQASAVEGFKGLVVGGVTGGVASKLSKVAPGATSNLTKFTPLSKKQATLAVGAAKIGAETTVMTTAGAAVEGRVPDGNEFVQNALTVGVIKGIETGSIKATGVVSDITDTLKESYVRNGKRPNEVARDAEADPSIKEDVLGAEPDIRSYRQEDLLTAKEAAAAKVEKRSEIEEVAPPTKKLKKEESPILAKVKDGKDLKEKKNYLAEIRRRAIDNLDPLARLMNDIGVGKDADASINAYKLARQLRGTQNRTASFIKQGVVDFKSRETVSKSFDAIVKPVAKDLPKFTEFLVAKRAHLLNDRGIKSGFKDADINAVLKNAPENFEKSAKELNDYQTSLLKYLKDSGMISQKDFDNIKSKNDFYVPFSRAFEESMPGEKSSGRGVFKIKGSERDIINPLETIIKNTGTFIQIAERNRMLTKLVDAAAGTEFVKKVPAKTTSVKVKKEDLGELGEGLSDEFSLDIFRADQGRLKGNEVAVMRDGKREVYEMPNDVAEAIKGLNEREASTLMNILAYPAALQRAGISYDPTFGLRNFIRGELSATVNSPNMYVPLFDGLAGMGTLLAGKTGVSKKHQDLLQKWVNSGGAGSTLVDIDRAYIRNGVQKEFDKTVIRNEFGKDPVQSMRYLSTLPAKLPGGALKTMQGVADVFESAPRFRQFQKSLKAGESLEEASFQSREIAVDFSVKGADSGVQGYRRLKSFFGAYINGMDKLGRELKNNPGKVTARATAYITVPTVANHLLNHYELNENGELVMSKWFEDIPQYQKDLFWITKIGDNMIRIPKPFEYGMLFGTSIERFIDWVATNDNKHALSLLKAMGDTMLPSEDFLIPNAYMPFVEQGRNLSLFKNSPLISQDREKLLPEEQYKTNTTQLARQLSAVLLNSPVTPESFRVGPEHGVSFLSPVGIENFVDNWTGTIGRTTLQTIDAALKQAGVFEKTPKIKPDILDIGQEALSQLGITSKPKGIDVEVIDIPIIRSFVVQDKTLAAQPVVDFFDEKRKNEKFLQTIDKLAETDPMKAQKLRMESMRIGRSVELESYHQAISTSMAAARKISEIPDDILEPREKRQIVRGYWERIIATSKVALETARLRDKALKEALDNQ
jgi:hypothetical protein